MIVPWTVWKMYGDRGVLERHFGAMTRVDGLRRARQPGLPARRRELGNSYNDWLAPGHDDTPPELLATAYWAYDAALMAEIADALGRPDEAAEYRALREKIGAAFADAFVAADGPVASGTQTAYALALHMGLIPDRRAGGRRGAPGGGDRGGGLAPDHRLRRRRLPAAGAERGTATRDVAYRLLAQRTLPSWRYMLDHGRDDHLGTLGRLVGGARLPVSVDELVQPLLARLGRRMAVPVRPRHRPGAGQRRASARRLLRPHPCGPEGPLRWAAGTYQSVRGVIGARWEASGGQFTYRVELPPGVTATVRMPGPDGVLETVHEAGPGTHEFTGPAQ